ncbi:PilX N-terminal domain-containing pilus assembly protein [Permianibacter aggregans]|uniref:PilX-like prepilin protein n=1 Tax=Permianibacter aggregans TaxID=1510150 RepID=A0A4R6UWS1_9GAMM|nr:PilX N-terminal domain-containing pilus assembly protein [Permianibacter aggregans]QGX38571.1 hypothetical protein E2H98_02400 [Permianibacter aggregans]TDQ50353.1 PilX-like prepilin protein [Permianibacter aggregans]
MKRQEGAALLVSLIILLILSIIGISAMRGGLLQELMASNTQQVIMAQNVADAGVEAVYLAANQERYLENGILDKTIKGESVVRYVSQQGQVSTDATTKFDGDRPVSIMQSRVSVTGGCGAPIVWCPGYSADIGGGGSTVACYAFEEDATGTVADVDARVKQWMSMMGPSCPGDS